MIALICLVFALVCFLLSAFGVSSPRINIVSLGLAFLTGFFLTGVAFRP